MSDQVRKVSLLEQREIEAGIAGPLVRAFVEEFGETRTLEVVRRVVEGQARESGRKLAEGAGGTSLTEFAGVLDRWTEGGALELRVIERTDERLAFDVTRCRYAEMYQRLGIGELGGSLSCCRDGALVEGFDPSIRLTRTRTIMEGFPCCDFRFERTEESEEG